MPPTAPVPHAAPDSPELLSATALHEKSRRAVFGLRGRALLIGIPLVIAIAFISVFADMVSQRVQFGTLQLAPPAVVGLFALALANRGLKRLSKRDLLDHGDVLVIYAMMLVGVMVSTRGVVEKMITPLAWLPYNATRENRFGELLIQHLPRWAVPFDPQKSSPTPANITAFWDGVGPNESIPWYSWVTPLALWFGLVACVILVFACLSTILRRQWMDNEQLRFPLTILPLAIIKDEVEGEPFFSNKVMWAGFGLSALVFGVNGLHANFPDWPAFTLFLPLNPLLTERPWNSVDYTPIYLSLAAVGFAYFLPTDLLFSLWFFFLLTRLQDVVATQMGGIPVGIGTHNARVWTGYQAAGAYIVLVLAQIRIGWPHFKQVLATAFGAKDKRPLDDTQELMSYRSAIIGLTLGFAGIVVWLTLAGMSPWLAAAQMGIYIFFVAIIMSRAVCEAGLLMTETSFLPLHIIQLVVPVQTMGATNLTMMGALNAIFSRDMRGLLLTPLMDNQKMAGSLRVKQRSLLLPFAISVVLAFVVAAFFYLYFSYTRGNLTLYGYPKQNAAQTFGFSRGLIAGDAPPPDATAYGGIAVGAVVTALMVWARAAFTWFPFHPLAYAIVPTWSGLVFWFPFLVAWILKASILRFGGGEAYRKLSPFMLGMILGEFSMAMFWAVLATPAIGKSAPDFPWP